MAAGGTFKTAITETYSGMERFVQVRNPRTGRYVKVDRKEGLVLGSKRTPYKNVKLITK